MMPSSNQRAYSRFIPSEEVGDVTRWKFGAVDGSDLVESAPRSEAAPELPPALNEAQRQALLEQACEEAYAKGVAQGEAQATLEWQRRMDDYVTHQGQEAAQRLGAVVQSLQASLADMQQHMAQDLLQLACDIARQVLRHELSVNPNAVQPVVREAVGMLVSEGRPALVRLNPADMETLAVPLREEFEGAAVQWMADAAVPVGGCLVESAGTVVDGSLDKRWQRAVAALGLDSAWQDGGGGNGDGEDR